MCTVSQKIRSHSSTQESIIKIWKRNDDQLSLWLINLHDWQLVNLVLT